MRLHVQARRQFPAFQPSRTAARCYAPRACNRPSAEADLPDLPSRPLVTMDRRTFLAKAAGLGFSACLCQSCLARPSSAAAWGYDNGGTAQWGGTCSTGTRQSPIDLPLPPFDVGVQDRDGMVRGPFTFDYRAGSGATAVNTGHGTVQVNMPVGNLARVNGQVLQLLQYHFHAPSEHALDGKRYAMEAHLVHKDVNTGKLAVLGVLLQRAACAPNTALQTALQYAPARPGIMAQVSASIDLLSLLPPANAKGHRPYLDYSGSLTTPPCSEEVQWFVFSSPVAVTDSQILDFMSFAGAQRTFGTNSRPLQPLGDRIIDFEDFL